MSAENWLVRDRFFSLQTNWVSLIGEHLEDHKGEVLEYWRVERPDSVVVVPIQNEQILLPPPTYRPGVGQATLDFPGGRQIENLTPEGSAPFILQRELGVNFAAIARLWPLTQEGWQVNSSFSNQKLYGFVAQLHPDVPIPASYLGSAYPDTPSGISALLQDLTCLQCRAVLLEWWSLRQQSV